MSTKAYRAAKEAFHADNGGSSIMSINAISLAALSAYAVYAARARFHPQPVWDYLETVLPLLLSITLFSRQPLVFNAWLLCIFSLLYRSRQAAAATKTAYSAARSKVAPKSKGKWLEESDSDEEPSKPTVIRPTRSGVPVPLPSEVVALASSNAASPTLSTLSSGPSELRSRPARHRRSSDEADSAGVTSGVAEGQEARHTAINVLPTPEMLPNGSMTAQQAGYPSRRTHAPTPSLGGVMEQGGGRSELDQAQDKKDGKDRLPFLSVYRAHMMVMTVHSILAVDFPIFPRWLGKTETFGTSLMDIGVGSFVFSLGIISTRSFHHDMSLLKFLMRNVKKSLPVIALGMVRVVMVKGVEYPEHVTEYGVHWNFFFTLALMPVLGAVVWPLRRRGLSWTLIGALLTIWHQTILSTTPLQSFVLSPIRASILAQNKEGLVSLPGYLAIYLLGLATGQLVLRVKSLGSLESVTGPIRSAQLSSNGSGGSSGQGTDTERFARRRTELALELSGYAIAYWSALAVAMWGGMEISRRMANLPYVLWTAAYNVSFLLGYLAIEVFVIPRPSTSSSDPLASPSAPAISVCPPLLEAINKNGLVIFLAANLLTGLVNMAMQTMYAEWYVALPVLVGYSAVLCAMAWSIRGVRLGL